MITLAAVEAEEKYDASIKALFMRPRILAPVIKMAIPEYAKIDIEEIITCITDISDKEAVDDISAKAMLHATGGAVQLSTEQSSISDKLIAFDVHFKIPNPKQSDEEIQVFLYVDIEVQNDTYESSLGYPVTKRAICCLARDNCSSSAKHLRDARLVPLGAERLPGNVKFTGRGINFPWQKP